MPTTVAISAPADAIEPVSLALLKDWVHAREGDSDELLSLLLKAARELCEQYTGRFFAGQTVETTFTLGEDYYLDPAAGAVTAVRGYFTDITLLPPSLEEYRKGISISRELPWGEALNQTYTVTYPVSGDAVPALVQQCILELAAEWYRNRETSTAPGATGAELPVNWRVKLAPLVVKPLLY